jgi:hypothetical protein
MYKVGAELFFQNFWNSIYTSPERIDAGILGYRLFPHHFILAASLANLLKALPVILMAWYLYRQPRDILWSSNISLSDTALLACLSLTSTYSQPQNDVILVLAAVFLMNYFMAEIFTKDFSWIKLSYWYTGMCFLLIHTHLIYGYLLRYKKIHHASYAVRTTIDSMPNYAILGLTLSLFILAKYRTKPRGGSHRTLVMAGRAWCSSSSSMSRTLYGSVAYFRSATAPRDDCP